MMENYRNVLKRRLAVAGAYNAFVLTVIALGFMLGKRFAFNGLALSFVAGFLVGLQLVMIFHMGKYWAGMRDEEKRRALYIEENDERRRFIAEKVGGVGINVIICALALAMVVSAFMDRIVFATLLCVLLFSVFAKGVLKLYFNRMM